MQQSAKSDVPYAWKPLVVCPNAPMALRVRSALEEQGFPEVCLVSQYPQAGAIAGLVARQGSNVCFLDVASNPERALQLISEAAPLIPVVALNPGNDADLILRCLRLGACEFLADATSEQVGAVLERLTRLHAKAEPRKNGSVCCVMPGKPGSGASTLATYLAMEMKRSGISKVLLVDTDAVTGSVAFLLKLKSDFHVGDAVRDWQRMDDDLWGRLVVPYHGVDILLAPENPATRVAVDQRVAFDLLTFWRKHYQTIVLDLPGAYSPGLEFAAVGDEILLVTTSDLAALHASRRTLECLEKVSVDRSKIKLVVTRYPSSSGLKREDVETALGLEPYALLSNDYDAVQAAVLDGKPVDPESHLGRSIGALAERLLGKQKAARKRSTLFGLLAHRS
jgi:Flp pilus assembly CpaE family ATPase